MTSKEALKLAILEYEKDLETDENNQWIKDVLKGLKDGQQDLEVLAILKEYLYYDNENHFIKIKPIRKSVFNYNYEDLKEWLENGKRKTDRNLQ